MISPLDIDIGCTALFVVDVACTTQSNYQSFEQSKVLVAWACSFVAVRDLEHPRRS
jgi:hypothetical protein